MTTVLTLVLVLQLGLIGIGLTSASAIHKEFSFANTLSANRAHDVGRFREAYAQRMKSFMNTSVDPCEDFYEYACGNYPNVIEDIDVKLRRSNLYDIYFTLMDLTNKTLHKTRSPKEQYYQELQKANEFYNSCVNAKLFPLEPRQEYLDVVNKIGGFPALDPSWSASTFDWFKMTAYLTRYFIKGLVNEQIIEILPFPPYFKLPKFGFNFDIYLENIATKKSEGYVHSEKVMRDLLKLYGVPNSKINEVIEGIIEFWREALKAEKTVKENNSCNLEPDDPGFVKFPRWSEFFEYAWGTSDINITELSQCPCDSYYNELDTIIQKKPEAAANYMAMKFLYNMHPFQLKSSKYQSLNCLAKVKEAFPLLITHFYMKEQYNRADEEDINNLISQLKESLIEILQGSSWLDKDTKEEAIKKIEFIKARLGQISDPISDPIIKEIRNLTFTDNYASNNLLLARFKTDMTHYGYLHFDFDIDEDDDDTYPPEQLDAVQVNAIYYSLDNSINIFAGILHPPIYHPQFPESLKYGGLGYILGHELTHSFDNLGQHIDYNQTIRDWWKNETLDMFNNRSSCFVDHYGEYSVAGLNKKINGSTALSENVADSGGIREALGAYRKISKSDDFKRTDTLPGIDLDGEQLYFLSFAQIYCAKYKSKNVWSGISSGHALDKYRVMGSLQNFEEFAKVYQCPLGSPMHPEKKCRVW